MSRDSIACDCGQGKEWPAIMCQKCMLRRLGAAPSRPHDSECPCSICAAERQDTGPCPDCFDIVPSLLCETLAGSMCGSCGRLRRLSEVTKTKEPEKAVSRIPWVSYRSSKGWPRVVIKYED